MEEKRRKEQEEQEKKMRMEMLLKQIQEEGRKREELKKSEDKKTINDLNDDDDDEDDIGATTSSSLKNFEAAFDKIIEEDKKKKSEAREHKIIKKRKKIDTSIITSYIENNTMYNRFIKGHTKQMSAMDPEIKKELEKSIKKEEKPSDEENVNDYDYDEDRIRKEKEKAEDLSTIGDDEMVHRKKAMEQKKEGVKVYQGHVIEDPEKKKKNETIDIEYFMNLKKKKEEEEKEEEEESSETTEEEENIGFMDEFTRSNQQNKEMEAYVKRKIKDMDETGSTSFDELIREAQEEEKKRKEKEQQEEEKKEEEEIDEDSQKIKEMLNKEYQAHLGAPVEVKKNKLDVEELEESTEHDLEYVQSKRDLRFQRLEEKYRMEEEEYNHDCSILVDPVCSIPSPF